MKALGATFEPGVLYPFALVSQIAVAELLSILVEALQPISLPPRNDSYSDSLYVLRSFLTLAVLPVSGYSNFHIVL